jgi:hypothetical protein
MQPVPPCRRLEDLPAVAAPTFKRLVGFFASILHLRARDEDYIAARYAGCGWNDAIEHQLLNDIGSKHNARL